MDSNISNYMQNQLKQAQQIEIQLEQIESQRYQIDLRIKELDKTLQELQKITEGTQIYKSVGPILYGVSDKRIQIVRLCTSLNFAYHANLHCSFSLMSNFICSILLIMKTKQQDKGNSC